MAQTGNRRRLARRLIFEIAVLSALGLHLSLYYLFRLPPNAPAPPEAVAPETVLLSPAGHGVAWERELQAWAYFADPSLLTLPNPEHGFSRVLTEAPRTPYTDFATWKPDPVSVPPTSFLGLTMPLPTVTIDQLISRGWPETRITPPPAPLAASLPAAVIWRFSDGTRLRSMPESSTADLRAIAGEAKLTGPTSIEIHLHPGSATRLFRLTSSGNNGLDRYALKLLAARVAAWERLSNTTEKAPELERFIAAPDNTQTVEIEWRLALPASSG